MSSSSPAGGRSRCWLRPLGVWGLLFVLECDVVAARLSELHGAVEGSVRPVERRSCKVGAFIRSLDSEDAEWLSGALDDPSESSAGLRRTLRAAGFEVARSSLSAHRRGECCCYGIS
nr:MAG TPA: Protein of unknown function (DUF3486) [Caudoviricetes sp.]